MEIPNKLLQKHITLKRTTLCQCCVFLNFLSNMKSVIHKTVRLMLYSRCKRIAMKRAITVSQSKIRPKVEFKMAMIDLFLTK